MSKTGRPSTYKNEYCDQIIEHMSKGASLASFAASIGTNRQRIWQWRQKYKEFQDACEVAVEASQRWWEDLAMEVATGSFFSHDQNLKPNAGMIQFIMSRRFKDYSNRQEATVAIEPKITYRTSMTDDGRMIQDILREIEQENH